jgi:hypothetical protein
MRWHGKVFRTTRADRRAELVCWGGLGLGGVGTEECSVLPLP